jgi:hypothetical protein
VTSGDIDELEDDSAAKKNERTSQSTTKQPATAPLINMYDSSSSSDDDDDSKAHIDATLQPLHLPFPQMKAPIGAGVAHQPIPYDSSSQTATAHTTSMFLDLSTQELHHERDDWFLVQLPTRLPPMQLRTEPDVVSSSETVSVPAIKPNAYDDILTKAVPGKLGKIQVYKSGKTVLLLQGHDGSPAVSTFVLYASTSVMSTHRFLFSLME